MGIGFVILFQLVAILIVSLIIAVIAGVLTNFLSDKVQRKRRLLLAFLSPFAGLYTCYFCALLGSIIVSEIKQVDVGIGDAWYVPLPNGCQLLFIDLPEQASIQQNGQTAISDVSYLHQVADTIIGKTYTNKYFIYKTKTNELREFDTEQEWLLHNTGSESKLVRAIDFYTSRRNEIAGLSLIVVGILSLLISSIVILTMKKIIWRLPKTA